MRLIQSGAWIEAMEEEGETDADTNQTDNSR